jgi:hypothetical protein
MANNTNITATWLPALVQASIILPIMDEYTLLIVYTCGIVGSLFNVFTLLQKQFRRNPCSLYFLSASTTDFFIMNLVLLMDLMRYFNPKLFAYISNATIWCQLGKYFTFLLPCLSSSYITLACIDRFCTSSHREKLRSLSRIKVSRILIPLVLIIWILFSLHLFIIFNDIQSTLTNSYQCTYAPHFYMFALLIDGYFFAMFNGLIVPIFLASFGLLIHRNVQQSRRRTAPMRRTNMNRTAAIVVAAPNLTLNRYNLHLITILLVQSTLTIFLNIPYMFIYLNDVYNNVPTNQLLLLLYAIFSYMARWFWYMNYAKTFYVNTLSSRIFRKILKQQLINLVHRRRIRIMPQIS